MSLGLGAYLLGIAELLACLAALGFGALALRRRLLPGWDGAPGVLAAAVIGVGLATAVLIVLGVVGALSEPVTVIALILAGVGASLVAPRRSSDPAVPGLEPPSRAQVLFACGAIGVVVVLWVMPALTALDRGMYGFDTHWYHMPFAARFAQDGSITALHYTAPAFLNWLYPAGSELLHAVPLLIFDRDIVSPLINFGWAALALLAGWCIGRPYGLPGASTLAVAVVLAGNLFGDQAGDARNDTMALALLLSAAAVLITRGRNVSTGTLVVAGLACGLALGTRLTSLAPVFALTAGVILIAPRGARRAAALAWLVPLLGISGWWYARNLAVTGNPLPFVESLGPIDLPGPPVTHGDREPFSVAHYATDLEIWGDWFVPGLESALGALWAIVLGLALTGSVVALARRSDPVLRAIAVAAGLTAAVYIVTPVTASGAEGMPVGFEPNLRYLAFALAVGLALAPIALERVVRRYRRGYVAGATSALLAAALIAIALDGERYDEGHVAIAILTGALAAAALIALALLRRPRLAAIAGGAVLLAAVAGGQLVQRDYLEGRYVNVSGALPYKGLDAVFGWAQDVRNARIGTTTTRQYPLYGADLSNRVEYISIEKTPDGFTRPPDCKAWRAAVNAGGYDFVVIAPDQLDDDVAGVVERGWTETDSNARRVLAAGPATVFEITGPLTPERCR